MRVKRAPFTRIFCHCAICQQVYGKEYSDPTLLWKTDIEIADVTRIEFKRQRFAPISVSCGTCRGCKQPVVGYSMVLPFLHLAFVPSSTYLRGADVPAAAAHIFYDRRSCDVVDDLPKYGGFLASEWAMARLIWSGLTGRRTVRP